MPYQGNYLFAGVPVQVISLYDKLPQVFADYRTQQNPMYSITMTDEMIDREEDFFQEGKKYMETQAFHRAFCERAIYDGVLFFHSSALMVDGKAYCFAAPPGTGKSTHARLWREMLGDRVTMINDDKPFLREENGQFTVYGSPWKGKHQIGNNISAPLAGICFLSQGKENRIRSLSEQEKFPLLFQQGYRPESEEGTKAWLHLMVELSEKVPLWHLDCTISQAAAELSYNTITNAMK